MVFCSVSVAKEVSESVHWAIPAARAPKLFAKVELITFTIAFCSPEPLLEIAPPVPILLAILVSNKELEILLVAFPTLIAPPCVCAILAKKMQSVISRVDRSARPPE